MSELTISDMMAFGQYRNWPLSHIPVEYYFDIYQQQDLMDKYPDIKLYIEQNHATLIEATIKAKQKLKPALPGPLCESRKFCYVDEDQAHKALKLIKQDKRQHQKPKRCYHCPLCGYWHHTKKP